MAAAATPRAGGGDHGLDGSPQAPPPGPRPEGTKEADEPEGEGGSRHSPLPAAAAVDEMTALSSGRDPTLGPFSHPEYGSSSEGRGVGGVSRPLCPGPHSRFRLSHLVVLGSCPPVVPSPPTLAAPLPQQPHAGGV